MPIYPPENPFKGIKEFPDPKDLVQQKEFTNKLPSEAIALLHVYNKDEYDVRIDMKVSMYKKEE